MSAFYNSIEERAERYWLGATFFYLHSIYAKTSALEGVNESQIFSDV